MAGNLADAKAETLGDVEAEALVSKRFRPRHLVTHWLIVTLEHVKAKHLATHWVM